MSEQDLKQYESLARRYQSDLEAALPAAQKKALRSRMVDQAMSATVRKCTEERDRKRRATGVPTAELTPTEAEMAAIGPASAAFADMILAMTNKEIEMRFAVRLFGIQAEEVMGEDAVSRLKAAAAAALKAFGSTPTAPQRLVSTQRILVVKAARSFGDAMRMAIIKLVDYSKGHTAEARNEIDKAHIRMCRAWKRQNALDQLAEVRAREKAFDEATAKLAEIEKKAAGDDEGVAALLASEK